MKKFELGLIIKFQNFSAIIIIGQNETVKNNLALPRANETRRDGVYGWTSLSLPVLLKKIREIGYTGYRDKTTQRVSYAHKGKWWRFNYASEMLQFFWHRLLRLIYVTDIKQQFAVTIRLNTYLIIKNSFQN